MSPVTDITDRMSTFHEPERRAGMSDITPEPGENLVSLTRMAHELVADITETAALLQITLAKISSIADQPLADSKQLLTLAEVQQLLGVSRSTVHRLTHPRPDGADPQLPVVMLRGVKRVRRADLDALVGQ